MNKYVKFYIDKYKNGEIVFNKERQLLVEYLEQNILHREDLHFDEEQIERCITFIERFYFKLQPFQKFLIAFVFLFDDED